MKLHHYAGCAAGLAMLGLAACDRPQSERSATPPAGYKSSGATVFGTADFSAWMTKAEQQLAFDSKPAGQYFAYTEGRCEGGLHQYRHVLRPEPSDRYSEWAAFWGLDAEAFYQLELKMLRAGFVREHIQVFTDTAGVAWHQAVWLKPQASAAAPAPR